MRFRKEGCPTCGPSSFDKSYAPFVPQTYAFARGESDGPSCPCACSGNGKASANGHAAEIDTEALVRLITDQVLSALAGAGV